MPIYLDDELTDFPGNDLAQVLTEAKHRLEKDARVVVEVQLDGRTLGGDEIHADAEKPLGEGELRLYSAHPQSLAIEVLEQVRVQLAETNAIQQEAAEMLQRDEAAAGLNKVAQSIDVWLQVEQAILHSTGLVGISLDELAVGGERVADYTTQLLEQLQALKQAIVDQDTIGLADALAYEWPELTDRWDALLAGVIAKIEETETQP